MNSSEIETITAKELEEGLFDQGSSEQFMDEEDETERVFSHVSSHMMHLFCDEEYRN